MKQRVIILCLVASVAILMACQAGGTNSAATDTPANTNAASKTASPAADAKAAGVDDAKAVLAAHDKALNDKSLDGVMATFSSDPKTVVLGTGSEEKWVGQDQIRAAYTEIFKDYDPGTLTASCDWKTGGIDEAGTMGWFAAICNCKDSKAGKSREYSLNVSAGLEKQAGQWKFVVLHMSNAFTPPVTK